MHEASLAGGVLQPAIGGEARITGGIGTITSREEKAEDVSAKLVDVGSRIETMRASVIR